MRWKAPSEQLPDHRPFDLSGEKAKLRRIFDAYPIITAEACNENTFDLIGQAFGSGRRIPFQIITPLVHFINDLMIENSVYFAHFDDEDDEVRIRFLQSRLNADCLRMANATVRMFLKLLDLRLPDAAYLPEDTQSLARLPLREFIDPGKIADYALQLAEPRYGEYRIFENFWQVILQNTAEIYGEDIPTLLEKKRKPITDFPNALTRLFRDTDLLQILDAPIPFDIPRKAYSEHGAIFAPSGHGKTQLLQHFIVHFLDHPDPPAMFIIDGMGTMLAKVKQAYGAKLRERLVIIEPRDIPALNFFQMRGGSDAQQMELFTYLFTAIDQTLTTRQETAVRFIVTLMRAIPGATLQTMREVMEDTARTADTSICASYIRTLDPTTQAYFRNQFFTTALKQTREQIANRLYTVLANPVFDRMFSAPTNTFDASRFIAEKKIVLINTDRFFLGDVASAVLGRYFIAQCLAAALARADIPPVDRHLALLIVDEAKDYFDAKTEKILSDARQFGMGLLFATQFVEQLPDGVRKAMYNNTAIKIAGPITYSEAVTFARETRTRPEFIQSMQNKDREYTEFAVYVRNVTPSAVRLTIPYGTLESRIDSSIAATPPSPPPLPQQAVFKPGDLVQVMVGGYDMYPDGVRVAKVQDGFVFVEGSLSGIPLSDVRPFMPTSPPPGPDDTIHIKPKPWD